MIELIQFPWSPFCIVQRRILEFSQTPFKITNLPNTSDRSLIWKLTKHRYYAVPVVKDGAAVLFETAEDSQVIAKYLDQKLQLGLFPPEFEGVQYLLWRYIENDVEGIGFKLNDIYFEEFVAKSDQVAFIRHKERKFGAGCIDQWRAGRKNLLQQLEHRLVPFEEMLTHHAFLLGDCPRFVDFNLFGILENFLYSGHHQLPSRHKQIQRWHRQMKRLKLADA